MHHHITYKVVKGRLAGHTAYTAVRYTKVLSEGRWVISCTRRLGTWRRADNAELAVGRDACYRLLHRGTGVRVAILEIHDDTTETII